MPRRSALPPEDVLARADREEPADDASERVYEIVYGGTDDGSA